MVPVIKVRVFFAHPEKDFFAETLKDCKFFLFLRETCLKTIWPVTLVFVYFEAIVSFFFACSAFALLK